MAKMPEMERLDAALSRAGAQWRDEDLDEILALLGEEPGKSEPEPQPEPEPEAEQVFPDEEELFDRQQWEAPSQEDDLDDIKDLLDDTQPTPAGQTFVSDFDSKLLEGTKQPEEEPARRVMELPDIRDLVSFDDEPERKPKFMYTPQPRQRDEEPSADIEEFIPAEPIKAGIGEQADFSEKPGKKPWSRAVTFLSLVAVIELAVLAAVLIVWQQWAL